MTKRRPRERQDLCKVTQQVRGTPAPNPLQVTPTSTVGSYRLPSLLSIYTCAHTYTHTHTRRHAYTQKRFQSCRASSHDVTLTFPLLCLCSQVAPSTRNAPPFARPRSFPSGSEGKASACNEGRPGFNPWVRKILWRRKWQPTPVPLPGKSHGWRSLVGYSPWGRKESDTTGRFHFPFHF